MVKISVIIPTHNRADQLKIVLESIVNLNTKVEYDVIVVDNNSSDNTKQVVDQFPSIVKYVFEKSTSFTKARSTGGDSSSGDILLYLDDDVTIIPDSFDNIIKVFTEYKECGVIAAKILPKFSSVPPDWCLACQKVFNGWSLYNPEQYPHLGIGLQEVEWAAGPMMAIRRDVYKRVGGFPPDTVGVETNISQNSFRKLFVGPGDYGLCYFVRKIGYKVLYVPGVSCYHVIPPVRFTISFWRARMICEGQQVAISQRGLYNLSFFRKIKQHLKFRIKQLIALKKYKKRNLKLFNSNVRVQYNGIIGEELFVSYYDSYFKMNKILNKYPKLWNTLWELGLNGVDDQSYNMVINSLPKEYLELVDTDNVYFEGEINLPRIMKIL